MISCVNLNPTLDICIPVKELKPGKVMRSPVIFSYPGGKATNTARALAALGSDAAACGFCASSGSAFMNSFLRSFGVMPYFINVPGRNRECFLITEFSRHGETIINSEGSIKIRPAHVKRLISSLKNLAKKSSYMVFSGSLPVSLPPSFYRTAIKAVKPHTKVLLDCHSAPALAGICAKPDILKMNLDEFISTFSLKKRSIPAVRKKIREISEKYCIDTVIVTMHSKGALHYSRCKYTYCRSIHVANPVSPVGSGDAFTAGYIYGLEKGFSAKKCLKYASAAAAANLSHTGSCFIEKRDVNKYLKSAKGA